MAQTRSEIQARYDAKNTKMYSVKLNLKIDSDIVEKLASVDSIQGYIKGLIRDDISRTRLDSVPDKKPGTVPDSEQ